MWLGDAVKIHWGLTDPTADTIAENDRQNVFDQVIATLEKRMKQLASFNLDSLSKNQLKTVFNKIGEIK
jgi:arsenate reductase